MHYPSGMKLRELAKQYPRTIEASESVEAAIQTLLWHGFRHLPVLEGEKLVGVVSNRDLAWFVSAGGKAARRAPVSEAMHREPRTAGPDDSLTEAAARMAEDKIGCLPITEKGELLSLLTTTDILAAEVREAFAGYSAGGSAGAGPTVADVMSRDPETAHPDDSLVDVAGRMQSANIRHLPVLAGDGKVIGMLSDRDLRSALGYVSQSLDQKDPYQELGRLKVDQAMSRDVISTTEDRPLKALAADLAGLRVGALPVIDGNQRLVGVISVVDVLRGLAAT